MEIDSRENEIMESTEYKLVCKARTGDERAYTELHDMFRDQVYLLLLKMSKEPIVAEDLTIETFVKAFASLDRYAPTNTFGRWLFTIAINKCIDYMRQKQQKVQVLSDMQQNKEGEYVDFPISSSEPTPEEAIIKTQLTQELREMVDLIAPKYKRYIEMRYYEELSYNEIAERLKVPLNTVRCNIFRARALLSEAYEQRKHNI